jgi:Peptidase family M28
MSAASPSAAGLLSERELYERVVRLAELERASASAGELAAAELIAGELRELGARVRIERETVHGTHWWPTGLPVALATAGGLLSRRGGVDARLAGAALAAFGAAAVADDLGGGSRWFRRRFLPKRETANVVAELGDPDAERTVLITAHHDAAHSGLIFHPELGRALFRRFPRTFGRIQTSPPVMWGAVGGPAAVALGSLLGVGGLRLAGTAVSAGYTAAMIDIGLRATVPGANDNLTGVAALLSLAHALREAGGPPPGLRVLLLSAGAEESHQEGMHAFAARHFGSLPLHRTHVICLDTLGSPRLAMIEGEGMLWVRDYPEEVRDLVQRSADEAAVELMRGLRFRNATDGIVALRAGYPSALLASVDELKVPTEYHWPTDTADRVDYARVADAARLCLRLVERLGDESAVTAA